VVVTGSVSVVVLLELTLVVDDDVVTVVVVSHARLASSSRSQSPLALQQAK
jgi:hypothetical protein